VVPLDLEFLNAQKLEAATALTLQEAKVDLDYSIEELQDNDNLLQSKLLPSEIMENYRSATMKLMKELQSMDFANHLWKLKTYDQHGMAVVKIFYGECNKRT